MTLGSTFWKLLPYFPPGSQLQWVFGAWYLWTLHDSCSCKTGGLELFWFQNSYRFYFCFAWACTYFFKQTNSLNIYIGLLYFLPVSGANKSTGNLFLRSESQMWLFKFDSLLHFSFPQHDDGCNGTATRKHTLFHCWLQINHWLHVFFLHFH